MQGLFPLLRTLPGSAGDQGAVREEQSKQPFLSGAEAAEGTVGFRQWWDRPENT